MRQQLLTSKPNLANRKVVTLVTKEDNKKVAQLQQMFQQNHLLALDTEFTMETNPWEKKLCYIQVGRCEGSDVLIGGQHYFHTFKNLFLAWLIKPHSLLLGFDLLADLSILVTNLFPNIHKNLFLLKVFDFYVFFRLLHPNSLKNGLKDWAFKKRNR